MRTEIIRKTVELVLFEAWEMEDTESFMEMSRRENNNEKTGDYVYETDNVLNEVVEASIEFGLAEMDQYIREVIHGGVSELREYGWFERKAKKVLEKVVYVKDSEGTFDRHVYVVEIGGAHR